MGGTQLKFVKLRDVSAIPRALIEHVVPPINADLFYQWAPLLFGNPFNVFGGFIDDSEAIQGIMWASYNPIAERLTVHLLSVDERCRGKGILKEADAIARKLARQVGARELRCETESPQMLKGIGWRESRQIIMEKNNNG